MTDTASAIDRDFDVVVFGASGFTGRLVVEYMHARYPSQSGLSWAVAGRDAAKLDKVLGELGVEPGSIPVLIADSATTATENEVTITAWIKRNGNQTAWSGIVFTRSGNTTAGLNFGTGQRLSYHWNDDPGTYNWVSGLTVPDNEWVFAALVVTRLLFQLWPGDRPVEAVSI